MEAVSLALNAARKWHKGKIHLIVLTDSEYVYGTCNGKSIVGEKNRRRVNQLLLEKAALNVTGKVTMYKVPARASVPGN